MISKISFSKMVRDEMRKLNWLTAVQMLVFGLLIPFRVLMVMSVMTSDARTTTLDELTDMFNQNIGLGHIENTCFILMAGALCALCVFGYVHSAVKLDFFHSIAVKREWLFGAKYLGSVLTFAVAYGVSQLLALLIGVLYRVASATAALELAVASLQGLLFFLCSYAGVLLAIMLTGKMLTTFLAVGVLGCYIPMIWVIQFGIRETFFHTSLNGYYLEPEIEILKCSSPWAFCLTRQMEDLAPGGTGRLPGMAELCQLVAFAAILSAVALLLYRIRKTESAGSALAFAKTEGIVKLLLSIPVALLAGSIAYEIFESPLWEIGFIVLFGVLACVIMEFIYRGDIRQVLCGRRHMAITVIAASAVFFFFRFDVPGYNSWLPEKEEVAGMAVQDNCFSFSYEGESYRGEVSKEVLDQLETQDADLLYKIAENGVEHLDRGHWRYTGDVTYIGVKYHLTSGKEVYRSYWVDTDLYEECMNEMMKKEEFRRNYFPIMSWEDTNDCQSANAYIPRSWLEEAAQESKTEDLLPAELSGEDQEYSYDAYKDTVCVNIPMQEIRGVIEAYQTDLAEGSYQELIGAEGNIMFNYEIRNSDSYPVSQNFDHTLAVLRRLYPEQAQNTVG